MWPFMGLCKAHHGPQRGFTQEDLMFLFTVYLTVCHNGLNKSFLVPSGVGMRLALSVVNT